MKLLKLSILVIVLLFVELTIISYPIGFFFILLWGIFYSFDEAFILAFIYGIFFDLFLNQPVGFTSSISIVLLYVVFLYQRRFDIRKTLYLSIFTFSTTILLLFAETKIWYSGKALVSVGIVLFCAKLLFSHQYYKNEKPTYFRK